MTKQAKPCRAQKLGWSHGQEQEVFHVSPHARDKSSSAHHTQDGSHSGPEPCSQSRPKLCATTSRSASGSRVTPDHSQPRPATAPGPTPRPHTQAPNRHSEPSPPRHTVHAPSPAPGAQVKALNCPCQRPTVIALSPAPWILPPGFNGPPPGRWPSTAWFSRDITLPTKVRLVKAIVFPVVTYGYESWTVKKAECRRIDAFELW